MTEAIDEYVFCIECQGLIIQHKGRYVCSACGLVQGEVIETGSYQLGQKEKVEFKHREHFGAQDKRYQKVSPLGSFIDETHCAKFRDTWGELLPINQQYKFRKLKLFYHIPTALKGKETDHRCLKSLAKVCDQLQVGEIVRERATFLYMKYKKEKNGEITNHVLLTAVSLVQAIREARENCPVRLKEVIETYKLLGHRVQIRNTMQLMQKLEIGQRVGRVRRSEEYVGRVCSLICASTEIQTRVKKRYKIPIDVYERILKLQSYRLLERIPAKERRGRRPYPFAAGVAYAVDKKVIKDIFETSSALTQKTVAKATKVAEYTIREQGEKAMEYVEEWTGEDITEQMQKMRFK